MCIEWCEERTQLEKSSIRQREQRKHPCRVLAPHAKLVQCLASLNHALIVRTTADYIKHLFGAVGARHSKLSDLYLESRCLKI